MLNCYIFKRSGLQLKEIVMKNHYQVHRSSIWLQKRGLFEGNLTERDSITTINTRTQNNQQSVSSLKKTTSCGSLNGQLAEQLITRMRRVSRVSFASPQGSENRKFLLKYVSPKRVFQQLQQFRQKEKVNKIQGDLDDINQQKAEQKAAPNGAEQKIYDLTQINQNLRIKVNQLQQQLFVYKQQIEKMLQEVKENNFFINHLQELIAHKDDQITQLFNEAHHLREITLNKINSCKIKLSIQHVINQIVTSYPSFASITLFKAKQQSASLRKRLKQIQRERQKMIKELHQQNQEQIARLKDYFAKNIQYYKKALIKFTTKQKQENFRPKLSELLQSTGLEISSTQQA